MKHKNTNREYAFLMVEYETPDFIQNLHKSLPKNELYVENDNNDYGIEEESHVTLVPCLDNDIDLTELKKYLKKLSDYKIVLTDISKFECDNFDVLKCNVNSKALKDTNKEICKRFNTHSEFKDYKPHMTIAYMKHGMADKYLKNILDKMIFLKPKNFHFSFVDKNGNEKHIRFE
jgi:hypothetical protein